MNIQVKKHNGNSDVVFEANAKKIMNGQKKLVSPSRNR